MDKPLISIIIPAYNVQEYIENTIRAAYTASDDQTEIIVINDGSTDETLRFIEEVSTKFTDRIKIISQENQGVSVARNKGIDESRGEYLIFCDGDDLCKENLVTELRKHLLHHADSDMILWGFEAYKTTTEEYTEIQGKFNADINDGRTAFKSILYGKNRIRLGSFAVKRELIDKYEIRYTVGCPLSQDVEFIYKCLGRSHTVSVINQNLFTYVKREGSVMFRYNMNRFEAPRTMRRIYQYIKENTDLCSDKDLDDYLNNAFCLQHIIYSFDACIPFLEDKAKRKEFWKEYYAGYKDVEEEIFRIRKNIQKYPYTFNKLRCLLMLVSRKIYVTYMLYRGTR